MGKERHVDGKTTCRINPDFSVLAYMSDNSGYVDGKIKSKKFELSV